MNNISRIITAIVLPYFRRGSALLAKFKHKRPTTTLVGESRGVVGSILINGVFMIPKGALLRIPSNGRGFDASGTVQVYRCDFKRGKIWARPWKGIK